MQFSSCSPLLHKRIYPQWQARLHKITLMVLVLFAPVPMPIVLRALHQSFFVVFFPCRDLIRYQSMLFYKHINQRYLIGGKCVCIVTSHLNIHFLKFHEIGRYNCGSHQVSKFKTKKHNECQRCTKEKIVALKPKTASGRF